MAETRYAELKCAELKLPLGTVLASVDMPDPREELSRLEGVTSEQLHRTYHGSVLYAHYWYSKLGVFARLVDRVVETANTGMTFHCETDDEEQLQKTVALARWWAANVNRDIARKTNIPKGLDYVNAAAIFNGLMEGQFVCKWTNMKVSKAKYPDFPLDGEYVLPMRIVFWSSANVRIGVYQTQDDKDGTIKLDDKKRPISGTTTDDPEFVFLRVSKPPGTDALETKRVGIYTYMEYDGPFGNKDYVVALPWKLSTVWKFFPAYDRSHYAVPPVTGVFETLEKIAMLSQMDKTTIKGFIRQMWIAKVGTDWHEPVPDEVDTSGNIVKPGDIQMAARMFENAGWTSGVAIPGFISIEKISQNDKDLLDFNKFIGPLMELSNSFGLTWIINPSAQRDDASVTFDAQGFLDRLDGFRVGGRTGGLKALWQQLWQTEVLENPKNVQQGLTEPLVVGFRPMTLNSNAFLQRMFEAYMQGLLAGETYSDVLGFDGGTQRAMVQREGHDYGVARISYRQAAVTKAGDSVTSGITRNQQGGRPKEAPPADVPDMSTEL